MDKTSTKPSKPTIGSKLQRNPFLANEQSNSNNLDNQKPAPIKKKTTTPAWLQKSEFASSKRASLQKMSQKVSSNPWKKSPTASTSKPESKVGNGNISSKLPTLSTTTSKTATSSTSPSIPKSSTTPTKVPMSTKNAPSSKLSINKGQRSPTESTKSTSKIQQIRPTQKLDSSSPENQQQKHHTRATASRNIEKTDTTETVPSSTPRAAIIDENPATETKVPASSTSTKPTNRSYDIDQTNHVKSTSKSESKSESTVDERMDATPSLDKVSTFNTESIDNDDHKPDMDYSPMPSTPFVPSHSSSEHQSQQADPVPSSPISTPSQAMSKSTSASSSTSDLLSELLPLPETLSLAGTDMPTTKYDMDTAPSVDFDPPGTLYDKTISTSNKRDSVFDVVLPWAQHSQEQLHRVEKQQQLGTITLDYDTFFQQLVVSHAISSSLVFPTVSFEQAQKLQKKYLKSNDHINMIGSRLLMETKAQRMILAMHKLSTHGPSSMNATAIPASVEEKEFDRLDQVDRLVEELIQWMHRDYARREQYLQHLAGTLAQQCTHLEQTTHSMESLSSTTADHTLMMKKETQWIMALRQEIIQLFEHHLPSVALPSTSAQYTPPPLTSYSASTKSMSPSSSSSHISGNDDDVDTFYNSNRTSMTSMMTDQQAHLYHRHHQNIVQEMKQFIQLLDQQLAVLVNGRNIPHHPYDNDSMSSVGAAKTIEELEARLKNEKQHTESLASQLTDLQHKWHHEVQHNQTLSDSQASREKEHQHVVNQLKLALEQQEMQHNQSGTSEQNQEYQQLIHQLRHDLEDEKRQRQTLETQLHQQQQREDQQHNDLDQERQMSAGLQSQLVQLQQENDQKQKQVDELNGALGKQDHHTRALESQLAQWQQDQANLASQYSYNDHGNGDTSVEMALVRLSKERDAARSEIQEWQIKVQGMESEIRDWQTKADHLTAELQTKTKALEDLHNDKTASDLQVGALESQLHHLQVEHEELQRVYENQQQLSKGSEHKLIEATQRINTLTEQVTSLNQQHQQQMENQQRFEMENLSNQNQQEDWKAKYVELEDRLEKAQQQFTHRESGYLLQSASLEAELEQILKEYDRLTRNIMDFNLERKKYEEQISDMNQHQHRLDQQLADLQVQVLGMNDGQGTTMALRKEFRQLMAQTKTTHQQQLEKEQQLRSVLEQERRDEKQEQERLRWDRVNVSVQTHFVV